MPLAIVDTGPLYAGVDANDDDHEASAATLQRPDLRLVVPVLVIAEVSYLISRNLYPAVEAAFLRGLEAVEVEAPLPDEWATIADLVERYSDFPLGATDASVAVLADRLNTDIIITLDRRHFSALRTPRGTPYTLLPE